MNTDRDYARAKALAHVQRAHELAFGVNIFKKSLKDQWRDYYEKCQKKRPKFTSDDTNAQSRLNRWFQMDKVFLDPKQYAFNMNEGMKNVFTASIELEKMNMVKDLRITPADYDSEKNDKKKAQEAKRLYESWRDILKFKKTSLEEFFDKHDYKKSTKDEKFYQILQQWKTKIEQQIITMDHELSRRNQPVYYYTNGSGDFTDQARAMSSFQR